MDRRRFLALLGFAGAGAAASAVFDPERLLWVPGARTFFLPPPRCNTFLTFDIITQEALAMLERSLKHMNRINAEYDASFQAGSTVVLTKFRRGVSYGLASC